MKADEQRTRLIDRQWFVVLAIIALVQPGSLTYIGLGYVDTFLTILSVIVALYCLVFYIYKVKVPIITYLIVAYHLILALFTLLDNSPNYLEIVKTSGPAIALCLLIWICIKRNVATYLKSACLALGILLALNMVSMLMNPDGLYTTTGTVQDVNFFLGFDNTFVLWTVPFVFHVAALSFITRERLAIWTWPLFALAFVTESMTWAVTGMITVGLEIISIAVLDMTHVRPSFGFFIGLSIAAFVLIVLVQVQDAYNDFFVQYFGKNATFTGRSILWKIAINDFLTNPLYGKGISNTALYGTITQPHCFYLEVVYRGGLFLLIVVGLIFFRLWKVSSHSRNDKLVSLAVVCVGVWLLCMTTDSILHKSFFWAMMVACEAFSKLPSFTHVRVSNEHSKDSLSHLHPRTGKRASRNLTSPGQGRKVAAHER